MQFCNYLVYELIRVYMVIGGSYVNILGSVMGS